VLMPQAQHLASPAAALVKQGEEEPVPQPGAAVQDRLRLCDGQDPRQFLRDLQRDGPAAIRLPLADVMQERLPAAPPARPRPAAGSCSHATNPPTSPSLASRQSRPRKPRKPQ